MLGEKYLGSSGTEIEVLVRDKILAAEVRSGRGGNLGVYVFSKEDGILDFTHTYIALKCFTNYLG